MKRSGARGVVHGDRQLLEVLAGYGAGHGADQGIRFGQFAFPVLDRDLPSGGRTYQHVVVVTFYQPPGGYGQLLASGKPPNECVSVE